MMINYTFYICKYFRGFFVINYLMKCISKIVLIVKCYSFTKH